MGTVLPWLFTLCHLLISKSSYPSYGAANDSLFPNQALTNGMNLVSSNKIFELGFFGSPPFIGKRYLGLWYKDIGSSTAVWVGNVLDPLRCGELVFNQRGCIFLQDYIGTTISVYKPNQIVLRPVLKLLDSGNLVFGDSRNLTAGEYLWQSFDHPVDRHIFTRNEAWLGPKNWYRPIHEVLEDKCQSPQLVLEKKQRRVSRWGPWDGQKFSGSDALMENDYFRPMFNSNTDAFYFTFEAKYDWSLKLTLNLEGKIEFLRWNNATKRWDIVNTLNKDICDQYRTCGPFGVCIGEDPRCWCPDGFTAASQDDWNKKDFTEGCRRITPLNYTDKDVFVKNTGLKLPDNATYWGILHPEECVEKCLKESSCMAYTNININRNDGKCLVWLGGYLICDVHRNLNAPVSRWRRKPKWIVFVSMMSVLAIVILATYIRYRYRVRRIVVLGKKESPYKPEVNQPGNSQGAFLQGTNVIAYDFSVLAAATNNFSLDNKIGHGGFGNVYKGVLESGVEIAVKKQNVTSRQGFREFENEVKLIAKLQHRNLTKLLGYCIHGTEKSLVYEFMENNSLDKVIFEKTEIRDYLSENLVTIFCTCPVPARRVTVTWPTRFNIIKGDAKGLAYMHHDSRLTIIHCDLKASNVLLDREMTPKISDLGLSRVFEDDVEEKTQHVIGTRGYMPPEYLENGYYSTTSDVFSFGILALEIVSGERNWNYRHPIYDVGLVGYAWRIWTEGTAIELLDPLIEKPADCNEVLGCILVGLLCCERRTEDRPSMAPVVSLLKENEMSRLNFMPQEPYF
ncbi:G-type lectin S-receptor-like serine/threonine-protein kinase [Capsicum chacoense]